MMNFKKFISSISTLAVAAGAFTGLAVTASAADTVTLLPTADTYISDVTDCADVNYGDATELYSGIWQEVWADVTPGLKVTTGNFALLQFNVKNYAGKITNAALNLTVTNPSTNNNTRSVYLAYPTQLTSWNEGDITYTNSGITSRSKTGLNIQPFGLSKSVQVGKTDEIIFTSNDIVTYLNEKADGDGYITFIVYGVGQECYLNSKEAESGAPSLELEYSDSSVQYQINYTLNGTTVKGAGGIAAVGAQLTADTVITDENGQKYFITADEAPVFTVSADENEFTVPVRKADIYNITVEGVYAGEGFATITEAKVTEGDSYTYYYPKYTEYNGKWYSIAANRDIYYGAAVTPNGDSTYLVNYELYDGNVVYYAEAEDIGTGTAGSYPGRYSNGTAIRNVTAGVELPAGNYTIIVGARGYSNNTDGSVTVSGGADEASGTIKSGATEEAVITGYVVTEASGTIKIETSNVETDYFLVVKEQSATHEEAFTFTRSLSDFAGTIPNVVITFQNNETNATADYSEELGTSLTGQGDAAIAVIVKGIAEGYSVQSIVIK